MKMEEEKNNESVVIGNRFENPRMYAKSWFEKNPIKLTRHGIVTIDKADNIANIQREMWLDYRQNSRGVQHKFTEKELGYAIDKYLEEFENSELQNVVEKTNCSAENLEPLKKWVSLITTTKVDLVLKVMAHWLSQVKRKMRGLPVKFHIMPVLVSSQQGIGKGEVLKLLFGLFDRWVYDTDLKKITDERNQIKQQEAFIALCDEMGYASKADIDVLKHQITTDYNSVRLFRTQKILSFKQNCSFIGTSNRFINDMIYDAGMRRFFQIDVSADLQKHLDEVGKIDYLELWRGIDERIGDQYARDIAEELKEDQKALVTTDIVDSFIESSEFQNQATSRVIPLADLYAIFRQFCMAEGIERFMTKNVFSKKLRNRGYVIKNHRFSDGVHSGIFFLEESARAGVLTFRHAS